jgi:hypothetical protein
MLRSIKLKYRVARVGMSVKARKPNNKGERKISPHIISRRPMGDIWRKDESVGGLGRDVSCSSIGASSELL